MLECVQGGLSQGYSTGFPWLIRDQYSVVFIISLPMSKENDKHHDIQITAIETPYSPKSLLSNTPVLWMSYPSYQTSFIFGYLVVKRRSRHYKCHLKTLGRKHLTPDLVVFEKKISSVRTQGLCVHEQEPQKTRILIRNHRKMFQRKEGCRTVVSKLGSPNVLGLSSPEALTTSCAGQDFRELQSKNTWVTQGWEPLLQNNLWQHGSFSDPSSLQSTLLKLRQTVRLPYCFSSHSVLTVILSARLT